MNKLKTIATYFVFFMSMLIMLLGIWANDTWEVLAGFWMMMYISERTTNSSTNESKQ